MFTKQEKFILSNVGKLMQFLSLGIAIVVVMLDPLRGRPQWYFGWLRITAICLCLGALTFSVWFDKFLNAIKDIHE